MCGDSGEAWLRVRLKGGSVAGQRVVPVDPLVTDPRNAWSYELIGKKWRCLCRAWFKKIFGLL